MRAITITVLATAVAVCGAVSGCGPSPEEKTKVADAKAAKFTPPSVISRLDYGSAMTRRFRAMDRNGDDQLDHTELPSRDTRLRELDRNNDGKITSIEFSEGMLTRFDQMDLNRDGTVTSEEREAARNGQRPEADVK